MRPHLHRRQNPIPHTRHTREEPPKRSLKTILHAYLDETADSRPHAVVWQLSPTSGVRYVPLVEDAAEEVDEDGDHADDGENGGRADALFGGFGAYAGCCGKDFEVVGTFFRVGTDKGYGGFLREGVFVAVEGDEGGFLASRFLIVFIVVIPEGLSFSFGLFGVAARGSVRILEDDSSSAEC